MKNKKYLFVVTILAITLSLTGCKEIPTLKNGEEKVVSIGEKDGISADQYYKEIRDKQMSKLVDMIDLSILKDEYKETEEETSYVESQIKQIKQSYVGKEEQFITDIRQYYGVNTEEELKEVFRLEYKRSEAVTDYIEKNLKDSEIKDYYDKKIIGDIDASHILIKPEVKEDATAEEKTEAEEKAKKEAEDLIKKLNDGEDFEKLAKEHSDDTGSAVNGGSLGYFGGDTMDESFTEAAKKLKNDEYTKEPVKSQFGYHIILKHDQKEKPKLKDVESDIKETLTANKLNDDVTLYQKTLMAIREEKDIKFEDSTLKKEYDTLMETILESLKNQQN